jgi:uncharacterized GH25 family protein
MRPLLLPCLGLLCLPALLRANDFWLEPSPALPKPGDKVALHLQVGHCLVSEQERELQLSRTASFRVFGPDAWSMDLLPGATDAVRPAGSFVSERPGAYLVAMERRATVSELQPKLFESYLKDEGLEGLILDREKRAEAEKPGRQRYERCLKTYLVVGQPATPDDMFRRELGLPLEIIPEKDPARLRVGDRLPVTVRFEGRPLANVSVFLVNRDDKVRGIQRVTTDAAGRAEFHIYAAGDWMIRLVHLRRAPAEDREVEWLGTWATYAFRHVPPRRDSPLLTALEPTRAIFD